MGTRHLIAIISDKKTRMAQYGQWDGYPSGQGQAIVDFLAASNLDTFRRHVQASRMLTEEELVERGESADWKQKWPWLSRDSGADTLEYIMRADRPELQRSEWDFAADSLMCEFVYVIDLDAMLLEVHEGFQKEPHSSGRFCDLAPPRNNGYHPVRLVASFPITDIPKDWVSQLPSEERS